MNILFKLCEFCRVQDEQRSSQEKKTNTHHENEMRARKWVQKKRIYQRKKLNIFVVFFLSFFSFSFHLKVEIAIYFFITTSEHDWVTCHAIKRLESHAKNPDVAQKSLRSDKSNQVVRAWVRKRPLSRFLPRSGQRCVEIDSIFRWLALVLLYVFTLCFFFSSIYGFFNFVCIGKLERRAKTRRERKEKIIE